MINFFKNLLKPKEEVLKLSDVSRWLESNSSELAEIKEKINDVKVLKNEVEENLKVLESVDLSHAKVEDRVKHIVQGNLPAYTHALSLFLKKVIIPDGLSAVSLEIFCYSFEKEFDMMNKRTFRSFQIVKELVGKELEDVAKSVKSLELTVKDVSKLNKRMKEVSEMKDLASFIESSINDKDKKDQHRSYLEKEKNELLSFCEKTRKDIESLKHGKRAEKLNSLRSKEENASKNLKELDSEMVTLFSPLQKALKKYNNIHFVKKVDSYVENPVTTLIRDSELEILVFLKDVKKMVDEGKIDLKDDKKKKMVESLETLNEAFIKDFIAKRSSINEELENIKTDIMLDTLSDEIRHLEGELNKTSFKILNAEREISKVRDTDINSEIAKLEKMINDLLGKKVKIEHAMG